MDHDVPGGIRAFGLIANPFDASMDESYDPLGVKLAKRNAGWALLNAMLSAQGDEESRPIVVEKSADIPAMYNVAALSMVFGRLAEGELGDALQIYVPLDMMRIGRTRAVLHVLAERLAGASADRTIGAWVAAVIEDPTTELAEYAALAEVVDVEALQARILADPSAFVAEVFGEPVESREGAEDIEVLMRVSHARQDRLDTDPDAAQEDDEVDSEDPLGEAFVTPLGDAGVNQLPASDDADLVAEYLIAEAGLVSPVLARGLSAYRAQGTNSMAEELKVTKAPSKTLVALMRFARARYSSAYVVVDRFDLFGIAPDELKNDIATALFKMRWALKGLATFVLLLEPGFAPQVEESFAAARRVSWAFSELAELGDREAGFAPDVAARWIADLSMGDAPSWGADLLGGVGDEVSAEEGFAALGTAIAQAAGDGRAPVRDDVKAALRATSD